MEFEPIVCERCFGEGVVYEYDYEYDCGIAVSCPACWWKPQDAAAQAATADDAQFSTDVPF